MSVIFVGAMDGEKVVLMKMKASAKVKSKQI